jgi:methionine-rich copper-binding protein CopC
MRRHSKASPHRPSPRLQLEHLETRLVLSSPYSAPSLGAPPAPSANVIWVNTESALQNAVANVQSGQTIVIQKGTYNLTGSLYLGLNRQVQNVTIRGETDNFDDVVLRGPGMNNSAVPMGISIWNAQNVTVADLSIGEVYYSTVELKGEAGANNINLYHLHLFNSGEQFVKGTLNPNGNGVSNSSVKYSVLEYLNGPPTVDHGGGVGYTNGVDIHGGQNWVIANNLFKNFHTPDADTANLWNPAILMWNHSTNTVVDGNTFINVDRAIALGLYDNTGFDHQGGTVTNNFIYYSPGLYSSGRTAGSDGTIIIWDSPGTTVYHNTVLTNGNINSSIQVRFSSTTNIDVRNNLVDAPITARDGASFVSVGNYTGATSAMFVNPAAGDLHLLNNSLTQTNVIDKVSPLASVTKDFDGDARPIGANADIGADEYQGSTPAPVPTVTSKTPAAGATGVATSTTVTATFNESVLSSSIVFTLKDATGSAVAATVSYNDTTHTATLTPNAALAGGVTFTATVSGAKDSSGATMTAPVTWSFTTAAPVVIVPTVTSKTPAAGATGVATSTTVTATFNESVVSSSLVFTLKDASGASVAATLSYNDTTHTATLTANAALAAGTTYTATVSGAKDAAGNVMAGSVSWSFTTAAPLPSGTVSVWSNSVTPSVTSESDSAAVELGMRFQSDVSGLVTGIKFYKGTGNTGTHVGHLWTSSGQLLATATFTGETASGWQTVTFSTPVAINANTVYVVSYHTDTGHYADDQGYFASSGVDSGVLHALKDGVNGPNGVYAYGASGSFPDQTWNSSNYWVDVLFSASAAPTVTAKTPAAGATGVATNATVTATFNESVVASSLVFTLNDAAGNAVAATVSYNDTTHVATLTPTAALANSTTYTATVSGAKDSSGATMTAPVTWSFTTAAAAVVPTVTSKTPAAGATGVATSTTVTATFNESVVSSSLVFTLKDASGASVAATLSYNDTTHTATLTATAALAAGTTYTATVSGAKDAAGNVMAGSVSWSFTTAAASTGGQWNQTTAADFNAGTQSGTIVTNVSGGEIQLAYAFADDFNGSTLGSGWTTKSWSGSGGGPTSTVVSGGTVALAGEELLSTKALAGQPVEGRVSFGAAAWQHFGLATDFGNVAGNYWAMFSTKGTTSTLFARVNNNGTTTDVNLGTLPSGYHVYTVVPVTGGFKFYVDGVLQTTINATFPTGTNLKAGLSSYTGTALRADWVHLGNLATSGTFTSSVFNAGRIATWGLASWTATLPAGTTITVQTRSGNTATPDSTWSAWTDVSNGGTVASPAGQYLQYRVVLSSTTAGATPTLLDVTFNWS